ncbi:MAG: FGGY family carbohydrate kinase [Verrucomicrobiota bacterium]|nr:FGGY family carbohydrate kinase [Verrucomicrobiota bacterium]
MNQKKVYLAVDLGAASGRVLAGIYDGQWIELHEVNRFGNVPINLPTGWHWNIAELYQNLLEGLKIAAERYGNAVVSVGIDTWGVDYALFDKDGRILGLPYQYRDSRTDGMMEKVFERVSKDQIYKTTGIQFIFFNSLFQLYSEVILKNPMLDQAENLLFMPDVIGYWLTGNKAQERSIASTSQLYNPKEGDWDYPLIESVGLP